MGRVKSLSNNEREKLTAFKELKEE